MSRPETKRNDGVSVVVHDQTVVGPVIALNLSLAKGLAAERTRALLSDETSEHCLARICTCAEEALQVEGRQMVDEPTEDQKELDDETEEGFATLARIMDNEFSGRPPEAPKLAKHDDEGEEDSDDWAELDEVEDALDDESDIMMAVDSGPYPAPAPILTPTPALTAPVHTHAQINGIPVPPTEDDAMDVCSDLPLAESALTTRATLVNHVSKSPPRYRAAIPPPAALAMKVMPDQTPSMTSMARPAGGGTAAR